MVEERLKLALRLKLDQLEDDGAVGFAWAAQDLAQEAEAEAHGQPLGPPPAIGRLMNSGGLPAVVGSAISTGGRTIMRGHG
jgi:hypothetical protein